MPLRVCSVSSAVLEQQSVVCAGEAVQLAGVGVDQAAGAQIHRLQRGTAAQQRQTLIRHLHAAWNSQNMTINTPVSMPF